METFCISLKDIRIHAYHGVMPQERTVGNEFSVSVSLRIPADPVICAEAEGADPLERTVNYAIIAGVVTSEMKKPTPLLETVALHIRQQLQKKLAVEILAGEIEICKITPPLGLHCGGAAVALQW